jgi:GTPase
VLTGLQGKYPTAVFISAVRSLNLSALKESIASHVQRDYKVRKVKIHVSNYKLIGYLYDHAEVIDKKHIDEEAQLTIRVHRNNLKQIDALLKASASKKHAATNL